METATITGLLRAGRGLISQDDPQLFLGEDFFPWMVLAFGAAMVVGNVLALLRPPGGPGEPDDGSSPSPRPPVGRAAALIAVGLAAAVWGLASLLDR
jgi:hypothetical protein